MQIRRYILPYDGKNTKFVLADNHESMVEALQAKIEKLTKQVKELKQK
jgi:phage-related minor tail protein